MLTRSAAAQTLWFLVENHSGLTESEYATMMYGDDGYQQRVNADSNYLERMDLIRVDRSDGKKRLYRA